MAGWVAAGKFDVIGGTAGVGLVIDRSGRGWGQTSSWSRVLVSRSRNTAVSNPQSKATGNLQCPMKVQVKCQSYNVEFGAESS